VPLRVCVAGVTGWTGRAVAEAVENADDLELVAGVSRSDEASFSTVEEALDAVPADVLVDYTHAAAVRSHVLAALDRRVAVVVGSSGLSAADYEEIDARALRQQVGVIAAGNFSLTAALVLRFAAEAARHLASWEVIDYASAGKADAPSGTSRELAERLDAIGSPTVAVPVKETLGAREARGATIGTTQVHSLETPPASAIAGRTTWWKSPLWRPWLEALGETNRVIRYDERGAGLSDWEVEDFSLDAWVATSRRWSTPQASSGARRARPRRRRRGIADGVCRRHRNRRHRLCLTLPAVRSSERSSPPGARLSGRGRSRRSFAGDGRRGRRTRSWRRT
jgi:4-hydroxy-tetrahydrodipicolinate reductase